MDRIVLSRAQFADLLNDFGNEVADKKAKKLDYNLWRPLYLWSKPGDGERDIIIDRDDVLNYIIKPDTKGKTCPNPVYIDVLKDEDFWKWIDKEFDYRNSFQAAWDQLGLAATSCSNALLATSECIKNTISTTIGSDSNYCISDIKINDNNNICINGESLEDSIKKIVNNMTSLNSTKEKENNNMKFGNFDFGPVDSSVRMSLYGMAIKNASGTYVAYDKATNQIMDVDIFNFEGANKFIYKMPVAIKDIAVGDVIIHQRVPMHVMELPKEKNYIVAIDPYHGERKEIVLSKSPFNFDFITKVVSLVDFTNSANTSNPFGNMLPLLLMGESKSDEMLPFLFMMNGQSGMTQNPMLMYALMNKGGKMEDMLPLMLMCGSQLNPAGCSGTCAGHCKDK
jgi:hypothetical protein